jgi:hypothetical protein
VSKHWVRTEDGPVEVEELEYCPYCQELTDPETGMCDNIYCGDDEEGECEECGSKTYNNESYCDKCLADAGLIAELNDAADFRHGTGAYE